jgi:hypothetical protein
MRVLHTRFITNENLIGLVNRSGVLIHHVGRLRSFSPVAFIFGERGLRMVNRWFARGGSAAGLLRNVVPSVNLTLNRISLQSA